MKTRIEVNDIYRYSNEVIEKLKRSKCGDLSELRFIVIKQVGQDSFLVGIYSKEFKNSQKVVSIVVLYDHEILDSMIFDSTEYIKDKLIFKKFEYNPVDQEITQTG